MSTRAKWIACLAALAVAGLVASIPAFLGSSESATKPKPVASYHWFDRLPVSERDVLVSDKVVLAKAPDGERLHAGSLGGEQLCLTLSHHGGGGCMAIDRKKQIQLAAKDTRDGRTLLWGILADDVRAVRIRSAIGSTTREARRAFGVIGPIASITALDGKGNELGSVKGDGFVPMGCSPGSCFTTITASGF
jgi:hypothetical protein